MLLSNSRCVQATVLDHFSNMLVLQSWTWNKTVLQITDSLKSYLVNVYYFYISSPFCSAFFVFLFVSAVTNGDDSFMTNTK